VRQSRKHFGAAIRQLRDDLKEAKKMRFHWRGLLCVIVGSMPIIWLFDQFERFDLARPALVSMAVLGFVIAVEWKLRGRAWFWITMTLFVVLHLLLILSVTWTTGWVPSAVSAGIGAVDLYVMLAIVCVVEKFVERPPISEGSAPRILKDCVRDREV
jgi:hypothetical protein